MGPLLAAWEGHRDEVAVAVSWAAFSWLALGCDARSAVSSLVGAVRRLADATGSLAARAAARLGRAPSSGRAVSLGEVSEMIDVVRLGLTAGLSFDAALGLYCDNRRCRLARMLERARLSWQMGMAGREEALSAVAEEAGVRALESFAASIGQALALGAPLAETLATQSRECRAAHRAEVERRIERAPVKLLIPTGTLILPALLLSILGPLLAASGML